MDDYKPDEIDLDWVKGIAGVPLNPSHPNYAARIEWRQQYRVKNPEPKKSWVAGLIIAVIVVALIVVSYAWQGNDRNITDGNCSSGNAAGLGC